MSSRFGILKWDFEEGQAVTSDTGLQWSDIGGGLKGAVNGPVVWITGPCGIHHEMSTDSALKVWEWLGQVLRTKKMLGKVQITPEMVRAGELALELSFSIDGSMDAYEDVVKSVFVAMTDASERPATRQAKKGEDDNRPEV